MTSKQDQLKALEKEHTECYARLGELAKQIKTLRTEIADAKLGELFSDGITFEKILPLPYSSIEDSLPWHRKITKWLEDQPGISASGYWPDSNQLAVRIRISRKLPLADQQRSIALMVPWVKPQRGGIVEIPVSERSLSEHGAYRLQVAEGKYSLVVYLFHQKTVLKEFNNLDEAVFYIYQYHSYD